MAKTHMRRVEWQVSERNHLLDEHGISVVQPNGDSSVILYGRGGTAEEALADLEKQKAALVRAINFG